jgi:hypothetical protein
MQPTLETILTQTMIEDRLEQAERFRRGNVPRPLDDHEESYESVTVRRSYPDDRPALSRLAERDGRPVPPAPLLVAEVGGLVLAARSLENGASLADPFHPTTHLVELLALRSAHLRDGVAPSPQRRFSGVRAFARRLVFYS